MADHHDHHYHPIEIDRKSDINTHNIMILNNLISPIRMLTALSISRNLRHQKLGSERDSPQYGCGPERALFHLKY
jgi:hypothetical protein